MLVAAPRGVAGGEEGDDVQARVRQHLWETIASGASMTPSTPLRGVCGSGGAGGGGSERPDSRQVSGVPSVGGGWVTGPFDAEEAAERKAADAARAPAEVSFTLDGDGGTPRRCRKATRARVSLIRGPR